MKRAPVDSARSYVGTYRGRPALGRVRASHLSEKDSRSFGVR